MTFVEWEPGDELTANKYGIDEPTGPAVGPGDIDVMLIPGVGFDQHGARIGHGVGFYDRYLEPFTGDSRPLRVGVAHHQQVTVLPPPEPWDVNMHLVVTNEAVFDLR